MNLIITTNNCLSAQGYSDTIARVFRNYNQWAENVSVSHGRLNCTKEGYRVRFAIKNFNLTEYRNVMYGIKESSECILIPLPVPVTSTLQYT